MLEAVLPIFFGHTLTNVICPSTSSTPVSSLYLIETSPSRCLLITKELESDIIMDLLIVFEDDMVKRPVVLGLIDPVSLDFLFLLLCLFCSLLQELFIRQLNYEVLEVFQAIQLIAVLLDLTLDSLYLLVILLKQVLPLLLLLLLSPLLLLLFHLKTVVVVDELDQVNVVFLEFFL